ncbi:hypothetical protein AGLY_013560 [Aphis glycines]|uniref:Uncharacterized protein n=1 Tax=Aphis glycines TaxID=307491 RepID=A0A6G0T7Z1_APHGL|nr:hypothetical protein AGLY_013560 [Aphis glycines]
MNFWNSFQKVKTWSAASYLFVQRLLEIVSLFILDNKHIIICLMIPFMTSWTIIYFANDFWMIYVARLIIGSVIFIFTSSLLVVKTYQILLDVARGYELTDVETLKRRFAAIFPPSGVLDSLKPREVAVADAPRTIDERLGALEDAVKSLSTEFAAYTFNHVTTNQAPIVHAQTIRAPTVQAPIHTSAQTCTVTKSWCYYHVRFGKEARKCSSDLCTFTPKILTKNKTFKKLYTSDKPEKRTYRYNTWTDF